MRFMISDDLWTLFEPLVKQAKKYKGGASPVLSNRMFFEALLYIARTGIPWRDLPSDFGNWPAVYMRFRRWISSGSLETLFQLLTTNPSFGDLRQVLIDSTIIRTHQHATGAQRRKKRSGPNARPAGRGSAAAEAEIPAKSW